MARVTLKAARVNAGLKQSQVAQALKVNPKTIWSWENGKSAPNIQKVGELCELYKLTYDDIIFLPDNSL